MKKNVYRVVNRALRDAKAKGVKIVDQDWSITESLDTGRYYLSNGCGCPMACLLAGKKVGLSPISAAAKVLSKPKLWVDNFIDGFDGTPAEEVDNLQHKDAFNFGKRLRAKHVQEQL